MTFSAVLGKGILVHIFMALGTILAQPEKGLFVSFIFRLLDIIRLVTFPAIGSLVRSGEFVTCPVVVKTLLIKTDHLKIPTMVLTMATEAILLLNLLGGMVTFPLFDPGIDLLVAFQTFFIGNFIAQYVALGTVENPLQLSMGLGKLTRRYLCQSTLRKKQERSHHN
ncbi:MAG: hypothetical protein IPL65_04455 [Lewinellaceae bacterium]|nr:hypothetical protein [Lewinellaceae bacterium]